MTKFWLCLSLTVLLAGCTIEEIFPPPQPYPSQGYPSDYGPPPFPYGGAYGPPVTQVWTDRGQIKLCTTVPANPPTTFCY